VLVVALTLKSPLFSWLEDTIFTLTMFLLPFCSIARSTWALRLCRFIAYRLCTVSRSLMFTITLRCVCTIGALQLCILYIPTSRRPLAAAAAYNTSLCSCSCCCCALFLISLTISRVALPTAVASFAIALALSAVLALCCILIGILIGARLV
jgi:hypothetical protein